MNSLTNALKSEIARVARKDIRSCALKAKPSRCTCVSPGICAT
jgi:hypothetical protein